MFKFRLLGLSYLVLASTAAGADELSDKGEFLDGIVAIVNEGVVLKSQLDLQIDAITERARTENMQMPPRDIIEEQVLEQLIVEEIQLQRASRIGIQISDQQLNQTMARLAAQNNIPFEQLPQVLAAEGIDYGAYRRELRKQLTLDQLRQIDVIGRISVAPREVEACLEDLDDNVVVNSEYNLSHILISVSEGATADEFAAAEKEANEVYDQLVAGADFAEMAVRHSDSQTNLEGGALGWRKGDQLPTLFADVVAPLEAGQFSNPVRAVSGYHIVKINEMRGASQRSEVNQMKVRHILVTPNEIIDDDTAKQKIDDAREQIMEGADFGEVAKLVSDDPGSVNEGGEMGWTDPGTFVPEFEEIANNLELGVVSEPFRSRFGWHILEVMDRRVYDNTKEMKERNCVERIRNSKLADESELWVRRIRDEAYVEKRIGST